MFKLIKNTAEKKSQIKVKKCTHSNTKEDCPREVNAHNHNGEWQIGYDVKQSIVVH